MKMATHCKGSCFKTHALCNTKLKKIINTSHGGANANLGWVFELEKVGWRALSLSSPSLLLALRVSKSQGVEGPQLFFWWFSD
jgi:hypothetical protein